MAHKTPNLVGELSMSDGVGPFVLTPAVAMRRFGSVMDIGDTCWYRIAAVDATTGAPTGQYEYGKGTYLGSNSLGRTTPYGSSNGDNLVNFGPGLKHVSTTIAAPDARTIDDWLAALGISGSSSEAAVMALLLSASSIARTEAFLLSNGG